MYSYGKIFSDKLVGKKIAAPKAAALLVATQFFSIKLRNDSTVLVISCTYYLVEPLTPNDALYILSQSGAASQQGADLPR